MPVPAENRWHLDEGGIARIVPVAMPTQEDEPALLDWALAAVTAAEERIATLEKRLAYLEGLSVTDELTGVLNHRGFMIELARAIAAARRGGPQGALILCDLDGFKAINDRHGHCAGNETLRRVAATLRRRVRANDVVGRLGGDEFALLLIGASPANAKRKCLFLSRAIATAPHEVDGIAIAVSASFGLASYDGAEDQEALLHRADMAMYADKRNRARCATL